MNTLVSSAIAAVKFRVWTIKYISLYYMDAIIYPFPNIDTGLAYLHQRKNIAYVSAFCKDICPCTDPPVDIQEAI